MKYLEEFESNDLQGNKLSYKERERNWNAVYAPEARFSL